MIYLTQDEVTLAVVQILEHAGPEGLIETEIDKALESLNELVIGAALMQLWREGGTTVGWDEALQDTTWTLAENGSAR